jgi:hypothetical protein
VRQDGVVKNSGGRLRKYQCVKGCAILWVRKFACQWLAALNAPVSCCADPCAAWLQGHVGSGKIASCPYQIAQPYQRSLP